MEKLNTAWQFIIRHRYACVIIFFILLIGVLDENSLLNRVQLQSQILDLQEEIRTMRDRSDRDSLLLLSMDNDIEAVRRIARERYFMKRDHEDVFVFVDTTTNAKPVEITNDDTQSDEGDQQ